MQCWALSPGLLHTSQLLHAPDTSHELIRFITAAMQQPTGSQGSSAPLPLASPQHSWLVRQHLGAGTAQQLQQSHRALAGQEPGSAFGGFLKQQGQLGTGADQDLVPGHRCSSLVAHSATRGRPQHRNQTPDLRPCHTGVKLEARLMPASASLLLLLRMLEVGEACSRLSGGWWGDML